MEEGKKDKCMVVLSDVEIDFSTYFENTILL
jgi:hypothetical protein